MSANGSIYAYDDQLGQRIHVKDTSLNFTGAWSASRSYAYLDVADHGGDHYVALVPVTGIAPPVDIWRKGPWSGLVLIAQGGADTGDGASSFLDLTDTPSEYGQPGDKLVVSQNGTSLEFAGPDSMLDLSDTPDTYGPPGSKLVVAENGTSFEFVMGPDTLLDLADAPDEYGQPGDKLVVAQDGTSFEFVDDSVLNLSDVPDAYGPPGSKLVVAANGTGMEFAADTFLGLSDTPNIYGQPGDKVVVAQNGTTLMFVGPRYYNASLSLTPGLTGLNTLTGWGTDNQGLVFDGITGIFTCAISGLYRFDYSFVVRVESSNVYSGGTFEAVLRHNATTIHLAQHRIVSGGSSNFESTTLNGFALIRLSVNDTIRLMSNVSFTPNVPSDLTFIELKFTGMLI